MSKSSPLDLAIAFRSFARRRQEAVGDADATVVADLLASLDQHVAASAALLGTDASAEAVSVELERRHPDEWDEELLDAVRHHATESGVLLRQIAQRVEQLGT